MGNQVIRYSERPDLWDAITVLSEEVWPEYNLHGDVLGGYWDRSTTSSPSSNSSSTTTRRTR